MSGSFPVTCSTWLHNEYYEAFLILCEQDKYLHPWLTFRQGSIYCPNEMTKVGWDENSTTNNNII